jgi:CTP-dependent riboflavin kinase
VSTETLLLIAALVSAISTAIIATYAVISHRLTNAINRQSDETVKRLEVQSTERHRELTDLYQAQIIAMMQTGPGAWSHMKEQIIEFNKHYRGQTKIF